LGNSTNYTVNSRSAEEAEQVFKNATKEVELASSKPRIRNVFISFSIVDEGQVNLLRSQARDPRYDLEFRDYSVKEPFDEKWKTNCRERISQTSAMIVAIGQDTAEREAVNWEIEESYRQGKKVIGVRISKERNDPIPIPLREHGAPIVNWNLDEIKEQLDR
jgi:Thoeris protein ThsB, TIR-like domain